MATNHDIEWKISDQPVPYPEALAFMEARVEAIHQEGAPEMVWLLEHPPLYTAGTSAEPEELLDADRFPDVLVNGMRAPGSGSPSQGFPFRPGQAYFISGHALSELAGAMLPASVAPSS